jgi:2'-5' RNA ligase
MRLFLAIELSGCVRDALAEVSRRLKCEADLASCSWVRTENLHVTLKFFGELPETDVPTICTALGDVVLGRSIALRPSRMELLPSRGPVRVIAAGLNGERDRLDELHGQIEAACVPLGFPPERRKFRPHVTLARARRPLPGGVRRKIEQWTKDLLPEVGLEVEQFVLMESQLKPDAAHYIPLARFPIGAERRV